MVLKERFKKVLIWVSKDSLEFKSKLSIDVYVPGRI